MSKDNCVFYLVRHGQSEANTQKLYGTDSALTQAGLEQVKGLAEELKDIKFDAIFSSDLIRAQQTAAGIALDRKLEITTHKALRERFFGVLEGRVESEVESELQHLFKQREDLAEEERAHFKFSDDYESDEEMMQRFILLLRELAVAYSGKTLLLVSHVVVMKNFLIKLGYIQRSDLVGSGINNTGYIKFESDGVDFFIDKVNGLSKR